VGDTLLSLLYCSTEGPDIPNALLLLPLPFPLLLIGCKLCFGMTWCSLCVGVAFCPADADADADTPLLKGFAACAGSDNPALVDLPRANGLLLEGEKLLLLLLLLLLSLL